MIVHFVDISGIVSHHCIELVFNKKNNKKLVIDKMTRCMF